MIQKIGNSKNKIASFLIGCALVATSCGEPKERQMSYMTAAERADYEAYGVLPDRIEGDSNDPTLFLFAALAVGIGFVAAKADDVIKKHRNQRLQQIQKNNQK